LSWEERNEQEKDLRFVGLSEHLCEVRAKAVLETGLELFDKSRENHVLITRPENALKIRTLEGFTAELATSCRTDLGRERHLS
jgi:hypothetical protein